jgi:hypothetical protein
VEHVWNNDFVVARAAVLRARAFWLFDQPIRRRHITEILTGLKASE